MYKGKETEMRIRLVLCLLAALALAGLSMAVVQDADPSGLLKTADEMVQVTARLRGLEPKAAIARGVKSRDEISQYLNEQANENTPGEIQQEEKLLRILGLLPPSVNYKEMVLKLYTEQVGGYYDPEKKTFFVASWLPAEEQKPIMVHELDHALGDQYFDLGKMLKEDRKLQNDDKVLAHEALREGDATALMLNYLLEPAKRNFSQLPDLVFTMRTLMESQQSQFEVLKTAPLYLRETMLFPYVYGSAFLQKVWKQNPSWDTVNSAYTDLPSSTEQIIHPEKYLGIPRDEPKPVDAEALANRLGGGWKVTYKNVLGEFSLSILLNLHLSEERSRRSAAGWGGDQVLLLENATGKNAVLVDTVWDNDAEADEFSAALQAWFAQHFPNGKKADEPPAGFSLIQDKEINEFRHEGSDVRFIIGLPEPDAQLLRDAKF